jgi:hypothetical protein
MFDYGVAVPAFTLTKLSNSREKMLNPLSSKCLKVDKVSLFRINGELR